MNIKNLFKKFQKKQIDYETFYEFVDAMEEDNMLLDRSSLLSRYKNWVYTCIDKKAKTVASLPYRLYFYKKDNKTINGKNVKLYIKQNSLNKIEEKKYLTKENIVKEEIYEHEILDLLSQPNKYDTRFLFMYKIICNLELTGECFIKKERNLRGKIIALHIIPFFSTGEIKIHLTNNNSLIDKYEYIENGVSVFIKPEDMIRIYYYSPLGLQYATSPVLAQSNAYDINEYLLEQQKEFLKNGATTANVFKLNTNLINADRLRELKTLFTNEYSSAKRTGKPMFLLGDISPAGAIGFPPKDLLPAQVEKIVRDMQLASFDMPSGKVGLIDDVNRATMEALNEIYFTESIKPLLMLVEEFLENYLCNEYDKNLNLDFDLPIFSNKDLELRERELNIKYGYTVINEERRKNGLPDVPWGDTPYFELVSPLQMGNMDLENGEEDKELTKENLTNEKKDKYTDMWLEFKGWQEKHEKVFLDKLKSFFRQQRDRYIDFFLQNSKSVYGLCEHLSRDKKRKWLKENKDLLNNVTPDLQNENEILVGSFEEEYKKIILATSERQKKKYKLNLEFDYDSDDVKRYIEKSLKRLQEINETTKEQIKRVIRQGYEEGLSTSEIARIISEKFEEIEIGRANNIARTETASAINIAELETVKQADVGMKKFWIAEPDARETHKQAGRRYSEQNAIQLEELFIIGDDMMIAPSQGNLAEENCNCRCALGYTTI